MFILLLATLITLSLSRVLVFSLALPGFETWGNWGQILYVT